MCLPGCCYGWQGVVMFGMVLLCVCQGVTMVARVLLWFTVCWYGCQDVVMVRRGVAMCLPGCCYGRQGLTMVDRVLLCICQGVVMFARVLLWFPGYCYGFQDVVMVARVLLWFGMVLPCVCQGVAMVARMLLLLPECCHGFQSVVMFARMLLLLPGCCYVVGKCLWWPSFWMKVSAEWMWIV